MIFRFEIGSFDICENSLADEGTESRRSCTGEEGEKGLEETEENS